MTETRGCRAWLFLLGWISLASSLQAADPERLRVGLGDEGLTSLRYGETELLQSGQIRVAGGFLLQDGKLQPLDLEQAVLTHPAGEASYQWDFSWGSVRTTVETLETELIFNVVPSVKEGAGTLVALYLQFGELKFAGKPTFHHSIFSHDRKTQMTHNIGHPGLMGVEYGQGRLVLCNYDIEKPLSYGFGPATDGDLVYPLLAYTGRHEMLPNTWPFIDRPLPGGAQDSYKVSIRFAPKEQTDFDALVDDIYQAFSKAQPYMVDWKDRRPIGMLMVSSSSKTHKSPTNPRGWFQNPKIDVTTEEGLAEFRKTAFIVADNVLKISSQMNAQGVIVWDIEGQEHPHPVSYIGDPRQIAPEFDAFADEFFAKFKDAGLKVGICIRPQRFGIVDGKGKQDNVQGHEKILASLSEKISYARDRWGCTLFYIDSNVDWYDDPVQMMPGRPGFSRAMDNSVYRELLTRFPDILMIPEHENAGTFAVAAPYNDLRHDRQTAPPATVLRPSFYPEAFQCTHPMDGKLALRNQKALTDAVKRGDIMFYQAWYNSKINAAVLELYNPPKPKWDEIDADAMKNLDTEDVLDLLEQDLFEQ